MRTLTIGVLLISYVFTFSACGLSQEEIDKRNKFVADSLMQVEKHLAEEKRIHEEKIEVGKSIKKTKLSNLLEKFNKELEGAKEELAKIQEWQLGRTRSEKEKQLENQYERIDNLSNLITNVEKEIALTELFNFYDFQESPEKTVQHIFEAAKISDYSKMRHLLDPYGEFDGDAFQICFVDMLPQEKQKIWNNMFKNGRIMGRPAIENNKAEIEIAYGLNSDLLEKITLVRRLDRWYVYSM